MKCFLIAGWAVPAFADAASSSPPPPASSAPTYGYWSAYGAMTGVLIIFFIATLIGLRQWPLKNALMDDSAVGGPKPSISRLIALLGFAVIISIYLGIGYSVVFRLLSGSAVGDLSGLGTFLVGAAALFTPYLANQVKSAVVGVANPQGGTTPPSVVSLSPSAVTNGAPQIIIVKGTGLTEIQSAVSTRQDGTEIPIDAADINVLNDGALQATVTMPAPRPAGTTYSSTLTLITGGGQRITPGLPFTVQ